MLATNLDQLGRKKCEAWSYFQFHDGRKSVCQIKRLEGSSEKNKETFEEVVTTLPVERALIGRWLTSVASFGNCDRRSSI